MRYHDLEQLANSIIVAADYTGEHGWGLWATMLHACDGIRGSNIPGRLTTLCAPRFNAALGTLRFYMRASANIDEPDNDI